MLTLRIIGIVRVIRTLNFVCINCRGYVNDVAIIFAIAPMKKKTQAGG